MNVYQVIKKPIITEKSHRLASEGKYVFEVSLEATKKKVAEAVEKIYQDTKVSSVEIARSHGKIVRWRKKGKRPVEGRRSSIKKAIVTLSSGKIDVFEKQS